MDWKYLFTSFDGRINRAKFWAAIGVFFGLGIVGFIIDSVLGTRVTVGGDMQLGIVGVIISLASIYFALAVYAKRWHDRDKSGWWVLLNLVPVIGWLWALIDNGFLRGTDGPNRYGPDPLAAPRSPQ
jgi:uncharacterized membrane protein YhaH (DUF805 family)